jgi:hypothetical protein
MTLYPKQCGGRTGLSILGGASMVGPNGFELEAFSRREHSASLLPKSRAQRGDLMRSESEV